MKLKSNEEADVNITALIDCLMQCIIFFMVIMSAQYVVGVAIKFPSGGNSKGNNSEKKERDIVVFVQADVLEKDHKVIQDGLLKINGEEIAMTSSQDSRQWETERKNAYDYLEYKLDDLIKQGYKKDVLIIQGDMTAYHDKIMHVIDRGKAVKMQGFSLVPPSSQ